MTNAIEYVKSKYKHNLKKNQHHKICPYDKLSVVRTYVVQTYHIVIQFLKSN